MPMSRPPADELSRNARLFRGLVFSSEVGRPYPRRPSVHRGEPMAIEPKSFPLEGKVEGFLSEKALTEHRDVLYKGYVTQYNNIQAALEKADVSKANPHFSEWGELKRRETWAHNGVVLH